MRDLLLTRRDAIKVFGGAAAAMGVTALAASCTRKPPAANTGPVILYTSADPGVVQQVVDAFTKATGFAVSVVTDTEATKTAGLVQRLVAERASPRAEVWWSSEVMGTMGLAREGLLMPTPANGPMWQGFAERARVIVYSDSRVPKDKVPKTLEDLTTFEPKGRIAMAQPQFGTTRTHFAVLVATLGPDRAKDLLTRLKPTIRLYPGNSSVVKAIAEGEADAGLTDSDDVWAGQANRWNLGAEFGIATGEGNAGKALLIPNTVGLIARIARPREQAMDLATFLASTQCERILAQSESRNYPTDTQLAQELAPTIPQLQLPVPPAVTDWAAIDSVHHQADALIAELFPV